MAFKVLALFFTLFAYLGVVSAICPGFNYGIGVAIGQLPIGPPDNGYTQWIWNVYDDGCKVVDWFTQNFGEPHKGPCNSGRLHCSAPPVTFTWYSDNRGQHYTCRPDPNSGRCGDNVISVCCRNDGRKRDIEGGFNSTSINSIEGALIDGDGPRGNGAHHTPNVKDELIDGDGPRGNGAHHTPQVWNA
ncbi:hypothetical protein BT63DRAFT_473925 [Microthyrium microscopicum]|uniref:Uncharacterized protein n=1 Tax=Microthyrium microscopicum TaxID=703497 RepID=A0A6A6UQU9_9PEZI|nr:hypothetical protein BT63DRAFT_473925 [Microthyrium microscopicum]